MCQPQKSYKDLQLHNLDMEKFCSTVGIDTPADTKAEIDRLAKLMPKPTISHPVRELLTGVFLLGLLIAAVLTGTRSCSAEIPYTGKPEYGVEKWTHAMESIEYCTEDCDFYNTVFRSDDRQLLAVNKRINQHYEYITETGDYWKSPKEFEADGGGDCEDFAIFKYQVLLNLGYADEDMEIVVGTVQGETHAVLVVTEGGKQIVLDNLSDKLLGRSYLKKMKVAFRINRNGWAKS